MNCLICAGSSCCLLFLFYHIWEGIITKKPHNKQTSKRSASSNFIVPASVVFFLSTRGEHFYGNWSPCNNSSWYACSTPDSLVASHTPSSNQLPATSQINKSSLPSPTLDAAALRQRWRQKDRHERFFYMWPSYSMMQHRLHGCVNVATQKYNI